jgi:hypothetical protein
MPNKGYVNVATSMRKEDAARLHDLLSSYGYTTLHQFLKAITAGNVTFTSKPNPTSQNYQQKKKDFMAGPVVFDHN